MPRALLTHGKLGPVSSKTANAILRFAPETVACVVDGDRAGRSTRDVLDFGPDVPIVADAKAALEAGVDELVIGVAPVGGQLPEAWRADVRAVLEAGGTVTSGLHTHLADDAELARAAEQGGGTIDDVRRPPDRQRIATGAAGDVDADVVYVTGSDCSTGKMTTAVTLWNALREQGRDAGFLATGQTGLMLEPTAGAPMDAVVSDFLAGEMEACVLECADAGTDPILVEGQGAIGHPGYGQVTMGMLLGAWPERVVMSHVPGRTWREGFEEGTYAMPAVAEEIELTEAVLERTSGADVVAVSLNTHGLSETEARDAAAEIADRTGLPTADPLRDGPEKLLEVVA